VLNPEQELIPELYIVCGYPARDLGCISPDQGPGKGSPSAWASRLISLAQALHEVNGFDLPPLEILLNFHSLNQMSRIVDAGNSAVLDFETLGDCVRAVAELETLSVVLRKLDSPQFAMWCGAHKSSAREQLLSVLAQVELALELLRSPTCAVHVVIPADSLSKNLAKKHLRAAVLLGLHVDSLQMLWGSRVPAKRLNSWAEKLVSAGAGIVWLCSGGKPRQISALKKVDHESGRVLKAGTLMELAPNEFLYIMDFPEARKIDMHVGIIDNYAVIDFGGFRRYLQLPAACSRMQAHNCTLSSTHIALYFTVKEDLWPTQ
jgi:hypothetical protein